MNFCQHVSQVLRCKCRLFTSSFLLSQHLWSHSNWGNGTNTLILSGGLNVMWHFSYGFLAHCHSSAQIAVQFLKTSVCWISTSVGKVLKKIFKALQFFLKYFIQKKAKSSSPEFQTICINVPLMMNSPFTSLRSVLWLKSQPFLSGGLRMEFTWAVHWSWKYFTVKDSFYTIYSTHFWEIRTI